AIVVTEDLNADAIETRGLIFLQLLEFIRRKIDRVWIQREEHSLNRRLRRFLVINFARVLFGDRRDSLAIIRFDAIGLEPFTLRGDVSVRDRMAPRRA